MFYWPGGFMVVEYFITMAVLSILYAAVRALVVYATPWSPPSAQPVVFDGKGIDVSRISERVRHVREHVAETTAAQPNSAFKRALMVEGKRSQISGLSYFQKPWPEVEPSESEAGLY